ncbi:MAG: GIY-YIG nuclease family protein [Rikenellaceae bacterium]
MQKSYVYIMSSPNNNVIYIGVTSDLRKRVLEHQNHSLGGFTAKYNCVKLVYVEEYINIRMAIAREKQLKRWERSWKEELINKENPLWIDILD